MIERGRDRSLSAIFLTFSGNCKKALTFYQNCFGGLLQFETFGKELEGFSELPVVNGLLISDRIIIHGSDLVHNEGRKLGNYISVFLPCESIFERNSLIEKLGFDKEDFLSKDCTSQKLIEIIDPFDVRWMLGVQEAKIIV